MLKYILKKQTIKNNKNDRINRNNKKKIFELFDTYFLVF